MSTLTILEGVSLGVDAALKLLTYINERNVKVQNLIPVLEQMKAEGRDFTIEELEQRYQEVGDNINSL